jgi:hypothetical protein
LQAGCRDVQRNAVPEARAQLADVGSSDKLRADADQFNR